MAPLLALLIFLIAGYTLIEEFRRADFASPLCLTSAIYLIHYPLAIGAVGLFGGNVYFNSINEYYHEASLLFLLIFFSLYRYGYRWAQKLALSTTKAPNAEGIQFSVINVSALIFVLIGIIAKTIIIIEGRYFQSTRAGAGDAGSIVESTGPLYAIIKIAEGLPILAIALITLGWLTVGRLESTVAYRRILGILMLFEFVYWAPTGRKETTIIIFLMPIMTYILIKRKFPPRSVILSLILVVAAVFTLNSPYRYSLEKTINPNDNVVSIFIDAVADAILEDRAESQSSTMESAISRLPLIEPLAASIRLVESRAWETSWGAEYFSIMTNMIPRFWWKDKPSYEVGNEFGYLSGLTSGTDQITSISLTYPGEAYLSFGPAGIIVGGLLGAFWGFLYSRLVLKPSSWRGPVYYLITIPVILFQGGVFALYYGGMLKLMLLVYIFLHIIRRLVVPNQMVHLDQL
jgi:hypothetical protein